MVSWFKRFFKHPNPPAVERDMPPVPTVSYDPPDHPLVPRLKERIEPLLICQFPENSENLLPQHYPSGYDQQLLTDICQRVGRIIRGWPGGPWRWKIEAIHNIRRRELCNHCEYEPEPDETGHYRTRKLYLVVVSTWEPLGSGQLELYLCKRDKWELCDFRAAVKGGSGHP